jgi:hypothetical protein
VFSPPQKLMFIRFGSFRSPLPHRAIVSIFIGALLVSGPLVQGYVFEGPSWPAGSTVTFQLSLGSPGRTLIDGNTSWDSAALPAFTAWDQSLLQVQFFGHIASSSASSGDGVNTITFATTVFGQAFGSNTLAVTYYRYSGLRDMSEADVLFNSNQAFDSYRGSLRFGTNGYAIGDIQRVLIHELGHALGLSHPDQNGQQVDAIMNSIMSNRELPSADDLTGAQSLYGARAPVTLQILSTNRLSDGEMSFDCVGVPNATNRIEAASDFSTGFTTLSSVTVGGAGHFQFTDVDAMKFGRRFYRVAYP